MVSFVLGRQSCEVGNKNIFKNRGKAEDSVFIGYEHEIEAFIAFISTFCTPAYQCCYGY